MVRMLKTQWRDKRQKTLMIPERLITYIAEESHRKNEQSGGKEGGRIVRRMLTDWVEAKVQQATSERPEEYRRCRVVEVECLKLEPAGKDHPMNLPEVQIRFHAAEPAIPDATDGPSAEGRGVTALAT
jgi:hypothetical protein